MARPSLNSEQKRKQSGSTKTKVVASKKIGNNATPPPSKSNPDSTEEMFRRFSKTLLAKMQEHFADVNKRLDQLEEDRDNQSSTSSQNKSHKERKPKSKKMSPDVKIITLKSGVKTTKVGKRTVTEVAVDNNWCPTGKIVGGNSRDLTEKELANLFKNGFKEYQEENSSEDDGVSDEELSEELSEEELSLSDDNDED